MNHDPNDVCETCHNDPDVACEACNNVCETCHDGPQVAFTRYGVNDIRLTCAPCGRKRQAEVLGVAGADALFLKDAGITS